MSDLVERIAALEAENARLERGMGFAVDKANEYSQLADDEHRARLTAERQRDATVAALVMIMSMGYEGAPDIAMRRIAREALAAIRGDGVGSQP